MNNALFAVAQELHIPYAPENRKLWFVRTQKGKYYFDYCINQFVGLGWSKVPSTLMNDQEKSPSERRRIIEDANPNEKRPGLIYGQLNTFANRMKVGDIIVIPSAESKQIMIGFLGGIINHVDRAPPAGL